MKAVNIKYITTFFIGIAVTVCALVLCVASPAKADTEEYASVPSVTITAFGKSYKYSDEKIIPSDFSVAEQIELRRINASLEQKTELVDLCLSKGADYKTALLTCFPRMQYTVDDVARDVCIQPTDARAVYNNGAFTVVSEKNGRALDENKLYAKIYCCLKFSGGGTVGADTVVLQPRVTRSEIEQNMQLRASYTTDYSTSAPARASNVTLAVKKLGGAQIAPGQTFSFNAAVGARTKENGFKSAKIIVDGKYTEGVGGGVCQASTALYNAALVADLACSANAHSICPSYCPAGLDAMISSVSDLVITNTTAHPIYIATSAADGKATVRIYGERREYTVVPESVTLKTVEHDTKEIVDSAHSYFDDTAVSGDRIMVSPGKDGVVSETYLKYYKRGKFIKRVKIRTNEYKAVERVIAVAP